VNQIAQYMKNQHRWSPFTTIKRVRKDGSVDISYAPTQYDSFSLNLTAEGVGGDVQRFLESLEQAPEEETEDQRWMIEHAKSNRSKCQTCGKTIQKDELRLGEPSFFQEHLSYRWHHLQCAESKVSGIPSDHLAGFDGLPNDEMESVRKLLRLL
jgi:hypothetical protein